MFPMTLRTVAGALIYDWPRYRRALRAGHWELMHNRNETISTDGRGVRCEWRFTSDLHIAKVFPSLGVRLMNAAFAQWPIAMEDAPAPREPVVVSFVIGHRGLDRLPLLRATLRSIAGQRDVAVECIVVEQDAAPLIQGQLPPWCRYLFTECRTDYNRAATFNAGVAAARGAFVILHDNDILVPARYAAEVAANGHDFIDLKRFLFYLDAEGRLAAVVQNLQGGSIAVRRDAYLDIGGFDEEFVGWGGEDNDFWDRAETTGRAYRFGYLPMTHLHHPPQKGKVDGDAAPAVRRYRELEAIAPEERIRRLRERRR
jgi:hypothetical protein